jgi:hypothetical protein
MAFALLRHAIRLVLTNWRDALKISAVLYIMQAGFGVVVALGVHPAPGAVDLGSSLLVIAASIVQGVIVSWIAVAWHRFVLLDEMPNNYVPMFNVRRVLGYIGAWLLVTLVTAAVGLAGGAVLGILAALNAAIIAVPLGVALVICLVVVAYRLTLILPASSVDRRLTMRDSWEATRGSSWLVIRVTLLSLLGIIVLELPGILVAEIVKPPGPNLFVEIWATVVGWFALMVGVALLTTMYGYYVERRPITGMPIPSGAVPPSPDPAPAAGE